MFITLKSSVYGLFAGVPAIGGTNTPGGGIQGEARARGSGFNTPKPKRYYIFVIYSS